jgi:hypothetical protein
MLLGPAFAAALLLLRTNTPLSLTIRIYHSNTLPSFLLNCENMATSILKDAQDIESEVKKLPASKVLRKRVVLETILKHVTDFAAVCPDLFSDFCSKRFRNLPNWERKVDTVSSASPVPS